MTCTFDPSVLGQFSGTTQLFKHWSNGNVVYTDGVQFLGANGCGWLLDIIATEQMRPKLAAESFQAWTLTVDVDKQTGVLVATDGDDKQLYRRKLDYTDCPARELKLFVADNTIMLASEY